MSTPTHEQDLGTLSRRGFLSGIAAGSLVLATRATGAPVVAWTGAPLAFEPDLFLSIAPDGTVSIVAHRSEMGTGIRTALPMVVADELGADWERVEIVQAPGDARLGSQNTDGSRSIRRFYQRMRVAGATARNMLERAAAAQWGVLAGDCKTSNHKVEHPEDGRSLDFSELVGDAARLEAPAEDALSFRPVSEYRYVGTDVPLADASGYVTGKAVFGIDARRENQLFAVIARSPVLGGKPKSVDSESTKKLKGVVDVIELPTFTPPHFFQALGGVAVLATNTWAAIQGRDQLRIEWEDSDHADFYSDDFAKALADETHKSGTVWRKEGDCEGTIAAAGAGAFEADYYVPLLSHAPMEPPCAVAEVRVDAGGAVTECEAWAPTQNPQAAQQAVGAALGIDPEKVRVNVTLLGGGFGRKSKPDFIVEAALLSKATGRPVHVTWTREDDIQHDYYHTVAAVHVKAAVGDKGLPSAVLLRSAAPPIASTFDPTARGAANWEIGMGLTDLPYAVPNLQVESGEADSHVRIGWLRSVAHVYHAFAVCSFPDELAHLAGRDPYEYLMELLGDDRIVSMEGLDYPNHDEPLEVFPVDVARLRNVTKRAAEMAEWGRELPKGRGLGIACHRSFLSYCANVVEVDIAQDGTISIPRVDVVIDAGTVVHPDRVRAQMEGAAVFGASLTMFGEITATEGRVDQSNFHDYRVARIHQAPRKVNVDIVASDAPPAGVGEVGVPPFAPALCNAIFAATGKRVRRLPTFHHDLSWS